MRVVPAVVLIAVGVLATAVGCSRQVAGTAVPNPERPALAITEDGYGIVAGFGDAPVKIEIYTEPQCNHCADLQHDFGDQIASYIGTGQLSVTYRPMTFLDKTAGGYSARVSNALFVAARPAAPGQRSPQPTGVEFQRYVQEVWSHQDRGGRGPDDEELAHMAQKAGLPARVDEAIRTGISGVDTKDMEDNNFEYLYEIDAVNVGTPTVYDLQRDNKLDIYDNDWLTRLMQS